MKQAEDDNPHVKTGWGHPLETGEKEWDEILTESRLGGEYQLYCKTRLKRYIFFNSKNR